jgi:hypothetical protein
LSLRIERSESSSSWVERSIRVPQDLRKTVYGANRAAKLPVEKDFQPGWQTDDLPAYRKHQSSAAFLNSTFNTVARALQRGITAILQARLFAARRIPELQN